LTTKLASVIALGSKKSTRTIRESGSSIIKLPSRLGTPRKEGEFFVCENITPVPVAGFFGAGVPSDKVAEHNRKGFEAAPASVWDPAARLKDQDLDGVQAEVIYTSMGMPLYGLNDVPLRTACFRAYNDWAVEYCSYNSIRLLPLGLVTLEDIGAATAELTRIGKKWMKGAMIWAEAPDERSGCESS